ncbi:hypothetical protein NMY22_g11399 [Coprinellus aureogranulatus]|nr:hypothetical protein NMY22_g11399 [Coprinellus aureogranulatus]
MAISDSKQLLASSRSPFYWETAVFKVEDTLFRVPKQRFMQTSTVFQDMFSVPTGGKLSSSEGQSDDNPIRFEKYSAVDFEALLRVLHPALVDVENASVDLNREQWTGVLRLSTIWEMKEVLQIRAHAIERLSNLKIDRPTPFDKFSLARDFCVSKWLIESISDIIMADELPPTSLGQMDADVLRRIISIQVLTSSDPCVRIPLFGNVPCYLGAVVCTRCSFPLFAEGATCPQGHTLKPDTVVQFPRDRLSQTDWKFSFRSTGSLPNCGYTCSSSFCHTAIGGSPLFCLSCQTSMAKIGLQAEPLTEVFLEPKRWKVGQLVRELFKDWMDEWDM